MQDRAEVAAFFDLYAHCEVRAASDVALLRSDMKVNQHRAALGIALTHPGLLVQIRSICQNKTTQKNLVYL